MTTKERQQEAEKILAIYNRISETGKIMMLAYSTAIRDKELAEGQVQRQQERQILVELAAKQGVRGSVKKVKGKDKERSTIYIINNASYLLSYRTYVIQRNRLEIDRMTFQLIFHLEELEHQNDCMDKILEILEVHSEN